MSLHGGLRNCDTADKNQSSWHMPCAVHLESPQISISGWHGGAVPDSLSAVSIGARRGDPVAFSSIMAQKGFFESSKSLLFFR